MLSENNNADERRNGCRIQARIDISTYLNNKKLDTYMHNLSCSGILIVDTPERHFKQDQECKISIEVGNGKVLELPAKTVWVKDGLVGLTFTNMDEKTSANLNQLILRLVNDTPATESADA